MPKQPDPVEKWWNEVATNPAWGEDVHDCPWDDLIDYEQVYVRAIYEAARKEQ